MKDVWVHSCCGKDSGECQGCRENMQLIKKSEYDDYKKKSGEKDEILESIIAKIDSKSITCEDINMLIKETTPESIRDRIRRRTTINPEASHRDNKSGHQSLKLPSLRGRIQPKRKPENQQNHGRSKIAHKHSTRTQRKNANNIYLKEALWIKNNIGKQINEEEISGLDLNNLYRLTTKLMVQPNVDRDWLSGLHNILEAREWELYHGSDSEEFEGRIRIGERDSGWFGRGFYLSAYPKYAARWGANVFKMSVPKGRFAQINVTNNYKNITFVGDADKANQAAGGQEGYLEDEQKWSKVFSTFLVMKGYDGVRVNIDSYPDVEVLVFNPSQVRVMEKVSNGR